METTHETKLYTVLVDDNFNFMDEDERYTLGSFSSLEAALSECLKIVGQYMLKENYSGMKPAELEQSYSSFGDDPFIRGQDNPLFSAWDYAKSLATVLAGQPKERGELSEARFRAAWAAVFLTQASAGGAQ